MNTRVQVRDREFVDEYVDMTHADFFSCWFDGCVLLLNESPNVETVIDHCRFFECRHIGDGWPDFLQDPA